MHNVVHGSSAKRQLPQERLYTAVSAVYRRRPKNTSAGPTAFYRSALPCVQPLFSLDLACFPCLSTLIALCVVCTQLNLDLHCRQAGVPTEFGENSTLRLSVGRGGPTLVSPAAKFAGGQQTTHSYQTILLFRCPKSDARDPQLALHRRYCHSAHCVSQPCLSNASICSIGTGLANRYPW